MSDRLAEIAERKPEHWVILFEDADINPEIFTTETAAREAFAKCLQNWACHLFAPVAEVSRLKGELAISQAEAWENWNSFKRVAAEIEGLRKGIAEARRMTAHAIEHGWDDRLPNILAAIDAAIASEGRS